jgi:hypothetical protein
LACLKTPPTACERNVSQIRNGLHNILLNCRIFSNVSILFSNVSYQFSNVSIQFSNVFEYFQSYTHKPTPLTTFKPFYENFRAHSSLPIFPIFPILPTTRFELFWPVYFVVYQSAASSLCLSRSLKSFLSIVPSAFISPSR